MLTSNFRTKIWFFNFLYLTLISFKTNVWFSSHHHLLGTEWPECHKKHPGATSSMETDAHLIKKSVECICILLPKIACLQHMLYMMCWTSVSLCEFSQLVNSAPRVCKAQSWCVGALGCLYCLCVLYILVHRCAIMCFCACKSPATSQYHSSAPSPPALS